MKTIIFWFTILTVCIFANNTSSKGKRYFLWLDGHANFERLATEEGIKKILLKAKTAGITDIITDLRGTDGHVLYPGGIAPVLTEYEGFKRPVDYDFPAIIIKEARRLGLGVYFSLNVFSEGNKVAKFGLTYTKHPEWQVQVYTKNGIVPITESDEEIAAFVNPILPEVRKYIFSIIEELLHRYNPDGIVLDRARYPNISGDFSTLSKETFEKFIGKTISKWPEDIYKIDTTSGIQRIPGVHYQKWLMWRAKNIHDFFEELRGKVKAVNPQIDFSVYVGSWYPYYYDMGVNWASTQYHPEKEYDWADSAYNKTGFAEIVDRMFIGNYFFDVAEQEAIDSHTPSPESWMKPEDYWWYSVEGSSKIAKKVTCSVIPLYGSLYVQQYLDENNPQQFVKAMKQVIKDTNGLMIFDVVHLEQNDWWKYVQQAIGVE